MSSLGAIGPSSFPTSQALTISQSAQAASSEPTPVHQSSCGTLDPSLIAYDTQRRLSISTPEVFVDPHSYAKPHEALVSHMNIAMQFDVANEQLHGEVTLHITNLDKTEWLPLDLALTRT